MAEVERMREDSIEEAVKRGYMKTDSDFLMEDTSGGSCCVTALITQGDLVVSNAGDCRAVMSRGGVAEALTTDHRPSRQGEKDRIEAMVRSPLHPFMGLILFIDLLFLLHNVKDE